MKIILKKSMARRIAIMLFCIALFACNEKERREETNALPDTIQENHSEKAPLVEKGIVTSMDEVKTDKGAQALIKAAKEGDKEVVKLLLEAGVNVNYCEYEREGAALIAAAENGNLDIMQILLKAGADVNIGKHQKGTPLMIAAEEGKIKSVKFLLQEKADIDAGDYLSTTALMLASKNGKLKCLKLLLDAGANVKAKNQSGDSAVSYARHSGHKECMDALVAAGADPNEKDCANIGQACGKNHVDCLQELLKTAQGDRQELAEALTSVKSVECLKCLHEAGANLDSKDGLGHTALINAAFYNHLDCLNYLLKNGVQINTQDEDGNTALHWAAYYGHKEAIIQLLTYGADLSIRNNRGGSVYESALCCRKHNNFDSHSLKCSNIIMRREFDILNETNIDTISKAEPMKRAWWSGDSESDLKNKRPLPEIAGISSTGVCIFSTNKNFIKSKDGSIFSCNEMMTFECVVHGLALYRAEEATTYEAAQGWKVLANYVKTHDFSSDPKWLCTLAALFELGKDDLLKMLYIENDEIMGQGIKARELPHVRERINKHLQKISVNPALLFKNTPQIHPITPAVHINKKSDKKPKKDKQRPNNSKPQTAGIQSFRVLADNVRIAFWAEYLNKTMHFMETDFRGWIKPNATFIAPDGKQHNYFGYRNKFASPQLQTEWHMAWEAIEGPDKDKILKKYKDEIETIRRLNRKLKKQEKLKK